MWSPPTRTSSWPGSAVVVVVVVVVFDIVVVVVVFVFCIIVECWCCCRKQKTFLRARSWWLLWFCCCFCCYSVPMQKNLFFGRFCWWLLLFLALLPRKRIFSWSGSAWCWWRCSWPTTVRGTSTPSSRPSSSTSTCSRKTSPTSPSSMSLWLVSVILCDCDCWLSQYAKTDSIHAGRLWLSRGLSWRKEKRPSQLRSILPIPSIAIVLSMMMLMIIVVKILFVGSYWKTILIFITKSCN